MPDILTEALQTSGLIWLAVALIAAGLVRGFAGFGSALIIMPAASSVLSPFAAIAFLTVVELFGPLPNLRSALRIGKMSEVGRMILGVAIGLPIGLALLSSVSPEVFNWSVSIIVMILLALLISGWRYAGELRPSAVVGVGGLGGFLAGICGLPGPPVIMFYMASTQAIATIRANFLLYLLGVDLVMIAAFSMLGTLDYAAIIVALVLIVPYMLANMAGALFFRPHAERMFRLVAYCVIAASAVLGLPIWM